MADPSRRAVPSAPVAAAVATRPAEKRPSGLAALIRAMRSWRTAAVTLLSFSSGLPLGLVWYAIPDWMRSIGVDLRVVGLFTLAQAPWAFKVLWSPLMDRYVPAFWGRRRGWIAICQLALAALGLVMAGVGHQPEAIWVVGAIAFAIAIASASQDIAYNAYMVDVLRPEEQGVASGAGVGVYRLAMLVSGGAAISLAARFGWPAVNVLLALVYVPLLLITWRAPEPEAQPQAPRTWRQAIWEPFLGFLGKPRAIEILAFVFLYKIADQLAQSLTRPFLIDMGYNADQRGIALATISAFATVGGAAIGGAITTVIGLGHALWLFGLLQIGSNVGYFLLAGLGGVNAPAMYAAAAFELGTSGLGTGAFSVLLLRITQKRFSATQYALFSSLFAVPRILAGPIAGATVVAIGWQVFYLATMVLGIPGLLMLARFVPPGVREPAFDAEEPAPPVKRPLATSQLVARGVAGGVVVGAGSLAIAALLAALEGLRASPPAFNYLAALSATAFPASIGLWLQLVGIVAFAVVGGLFVAAWSAARGRAGS
jgi:PAT family beta-lactamase induction signal transducer AmpG